MQRCLRCEANRGLVPAKTILLLHNSSINPEGKTPNVFEIQFQVYTVLKWLSIAQ